jgi:hypothetical protein
VTQDTVEKDNFNDAEDSFDSLLELSTQVAPAKKFTVDGDSFDLLSLSHVGKDEEARLMALYRRMERFSRSYDVSKNDQDAEKAANGIRSTRIEIICRFTTLPRHIAEALPLPAQVQLLQAIAAEMGVVGAAEDETE